jgi:hypothetical protein
MVTAGKSDRILWTCDEITNIGFGNFIGLSSDILVGNIFYHTCPSTLGIAWFRSMHSSICLLPDNITCPVGGFGCLFGEKSFKLQDSRPKSAFTENPSIDLLQQSNLIETCTLF